MRYNQFEKLGLIDLASIDPVLLGEYRYNNGAFRLRDAGGVYDPRTAWKTPHAQLPSLPHILRQWCGTAAVRVTQASPFPTQQTWYYDQAATKKAAVINLTRLSTTMQVSQSVTTLYDSDGSTVIAQCTDAYTYSGIYETRMTRSWSTPAVP